jgi:D-glycero-alpha-D-manno-heptose-7-phosphate kinase
MPIGKQDQYASACGGVNALVFATTGVQVEPLDLAPDLVAALDRRLLLFSTGRQRDSAGILRQQQRDSAANAAVIESLHRIKALALEIRAALLAGDLDRFGRLLDEGWQHKRRLSSRISSGAIDRWYAAARAAGAGGGKIAGAGGGGFLLLYCSPERQPDVRAAMAEHGLAELPFEFDLAGARVLHDSAGLPHLAAREVGMPPGAISSA